MTHPMRAGTHRGGVPELSKKMDNGPQGRSVPVSKGQPPKNSMIDGPFGGKKPA